MCVDCTGDQRKQTITHTAASVLLPLFRGNRASLFFSTDMNHSPTEILTDFTRFLKFGSIQKIGSIQIIILEILNFSFSVYSLVNIIN